jgi:hypothetical protein
MMRGYSWQRKGKKRHREETGKREKDEGEEKEKFS